MAEVFAMPDNIIDHMTAAVKQMRGDDNCKNLLKNHLTTKVYEDLKNDKTGMGGSLWHCIASGCNNTGERIGLFASDAEAYNLYQTLFFPLLKELHQVDELKCPKTNFGEGNLRDLKVLDPNNDVVISTQINLVRSLADIPFQPLMDESKYLAVESKVKDALECLSDADLIGEYYPLATINILERERLIKDDYLFPKPDKYLEDAGTGRHWPKGRGLYYNREKTFLAWVNYIEHVRLISMQHGSNIRQVYDRLIRAVRGVQSNMPFYRDDRIGNITFSPTNLGNSIRMSVTMKLNNVSADKMKSIESQYFVVIKEKRDTKINQHFFVVSSGKNFGLTEWQTVKNTYDAVAELVKLETQKPE